MASRAIHRLAVAAILAGTVAGCAKEPPVQVVSDSFCQAAKKRTWSVDDTPETISEAIRQNQGIDRACGIPGKSKGTPVS